MTTFTTLSTIGVPVELDPQQLAAAYAFHYKFSNDIECGCSSDGLDRYETTTRLHITGSQMFAVFRLAAHELTRGELRSAENGNFEYRPLLIDGKLVRKLGVGHMPAVAHLMNHSAHWSTNEPEWWVVFLVSPWQPAQQIEVESMRRIQEIADETLRELHGR